MSAEKVLFALLSCGVRGEKPEEKLKDLLTPETLAEVYRLSKRYDLAGLAGQVLNDFGALGDDSVSQQFKQESMLAVHRFIRMNYEYQSVCKALEEVGISFIPLKGAVIRAYYPNPWMRTSCDVDILVREESLDDAVVALTQKLNYRRSDKSAYDVSLFSPSGVHFELHYKLFDPIAAPVWSKPLKSVWSFAVPAKGFQYQCQLPDALYYYYHITHMAKHFKAGGCGIRPILDVWILNHNVAHSKTKREALLAEGGLEKFAEQMEILSEVWFSNAVPTELSAQVERFILDAGAYGRKDRSIAVEQVQSGGKLKYMLSRVFLPYETLKYYYPVLQKNKWLLPVFEVVRWVELLFGNGFKYWRLMMTDTVIKDEDRSAVTDLLQRLGFH